MMRFYLMLCIGLYSSGCFAAQRDAVNAKADKRIQELDQLCQSNMTDWCIIQYSIVQRNREQELRDISDRQKAAAHSIEEAGKPFGELGKKR